MILVGDIGGTKVNLCTMERVNGRFQGAHYETYHSGEHDSFEAVLRAHLATHSLTVDAMVIGVAGPVSDGHVETTNLPWVLDAGDLQRTFGIQAVDLLNDLAATGNGIAELQPDELVTLQEGDPEAHGNAVITAAGTGLGEGGLFWDGGQYRPIASEGAHTEFGPRNALEDALLLFLRSEYTHVSYERIVSGMGIANIYRFLRDGQRIAESDAEQTRLREAIDPSVISELAVAGDHELSRRTMALFVDIYGAETGNLALKIVAYGGAYVGGGIAPKILPLLQDGRFMDAFRDKGRFRSVMERIPVRVILNEKTALLGAARHAESLLA